MARVLRVLKSRPVFTMADQGIVSVGNFLSGIILARHLPETSYGTYALLLETMLFLNSLQAALITYPMSVRGASDNPLRLRRLASASLWMTVVLLPVLGLAMCVGVICGASRSGGTVALIALAGSAIVAMLLWQMQETMRRGLMAELRFGACVPGDAISYLGQVLLLFLLATSGMLTLPRAFAVIAATSALAVGLQAVQIGVVRVTLREIADIAKDFWKLGSWTLLANLAMLVTTIGYTWTLRISRGLDETAAFAAMLVPFKLANPLLLGVANLLVPAVARTAKEEGVRATVRIAGQNVLFGGAAILGYYALLAAFPTFALTVAFGHDSPYLKEAGFLRFYVLNMAMMYAEMVLLGWLSGLGESRANFVSQVIQATITLLIALPATAMYGIPGLMAGGLIGTTVGVIAQLVLLRRVLAVDVAASWPPVTASAGSLPALD